MTARSFPILMYHQVGTPAPRGTPSRSLCVTPEDFAAHMRWLKRFGYRGVSMRDLMPYLRGQKTGKVVGITFDDGYRNVHANALPVLQELGFTATNYFVSGEIDGFNRWDVAKGIPQAACMSKAELLEWAGLGHEVGSHTSSHPRLERIAADDARQEIFDSRRRLEDMIGGPVEAFCYPHGGVNAVVRELVHEAGYTSATTIESRHSRGSDDPLLLPRLTVRRGYGWARVLMKCLIG